MIFITIKVKILFSTKLYKYIPVTYWLLLYFLFRFQFIPSDKVWDNENRDLSWFFPLAGLFRPILPRSDKYIRYAIWYKTRNCKLLSILESISAWIKGSLRSTRINFSSRFSLRSRKGDSVCNLEIACVSATTPLSRESTLTTLGRNRSRIDDSCDALN